jgi:hypothetical protein
VPLERASTQGLVHRLFPAGSRQRLELMRAAWPLAVGKDLACRTEVLALEGRTLRVRVPDARWRKVLHRMRGQIVERLQAVAGDAAPDRLGLQEEQMGAPRMVPSPAVRVAAPAAPALAPAAVSAAAEAIADEGLRRAFLDTAARYLGRSSPPADPTEKKNA